LKDTSGRRTEEEMTVGWDREIERPRRLFLEKSYIAPIAERKYGCCFFEVSSAEEG
jgi:hypothetical protein